MESKIYFHLLPRLQKFSINTPVQAVPGLLLLLAVDCTTRGMMTRVTLFSGGSSVGPGDHGPPVGDLKFFFASILLL